MEQPKRQSPWFDSVPDERRWPELSSPLECDTVVIGGGIAGIMTAWRFAESERDVVLLEKNHLATGDTGFTTAFITRVPDVPSLSELAKKYGQDFANEVFLATTKAQDYLKTLIANERIECDFQEVPSYFGAYKAGDALLAAEWNGIKKADAAATWLEKKDVPEKVPFAQAIRFDGEAKFDVRKFLFGLLKRPIASRIKVFEESGVEKIEIGKHILVETAHGSIRAKHIVLATGFPHAAFPELQKLVVRKTTFALNARFDEEAPLADALFWDTDKPYQYFRRFDGHTVMLGGADKAVGEKANQEPYAALETFLQEKVGKEFRVTTVWSGSLLETEDGLPFISEHPGYPGKVFFITGFSGNGMVMGTLAGLLTHDLVKNMRPSFAQCFSFKRIPSVAFSLTARSEAKSGVMQRSGWISALRILLPLLFLGLFSIPSLEFFHLRGGTSFLRGLLLKDFAFRIFPLLGLYAFFLLWVQFLLGSSMPILRKIYPNIVRFHRAEGVFVLLFAMFHPLFLEIGVGWSSYWARNFVPLHLVPYIWVGYVQISLLFLTAGSALLAKIPLIQRYWRRIHYLNYAVFALVWIHSWFLGTDIRSTSLRWIWIFFGATALASTLGRMIRTPKKRNASNPLINTKGEKTMPTSNGFTEAAREQDLEEGRPHCIEVGSKQLLLVKVRGTYYALDNLCSHAGGSLCEGSLDGEVIECPLHGSRFDVKNGNVVQGPAEQPQKTYPIQVRDGAIFVKM